jgi:hypothetical protein
VLNHMFKAAMPILYVWILSELLHVRH